MKRSVVNLKIILSIIYSWLITRPTEIIRLFRHKDYYKCDSYYPEFNDRKRSSLQILGDQLRAILKYSKPNKYYFSYGLDVKPRSEQDKYANFDWFFKRVCHLNQSPTINCCCILRDKIMFNIFANGIGINTPQNVLYSTNGQLFDYRTQKEITASALPVIGCNTLFCKLVDGECGRGIFRLSFSDGEVFIDEKKCMPQEAYSALTSGRYLAQTVITQHPKMAMLHPQSINTLRIVTVRSLKDGIIRVWPSIIRIGTGSSIVDNTSQGGICVGINFETAHLKQWGFYKPQFGRKTDRHPDSGIVFSDFEIPFLQDAVNQAIYFHSMLPGMQSVGWDIAIGEDGPIFIEGNDNWEINGPQICNGGLKEMFVDQMFE